MKICIGFTLIETHYAVGASPEKFDAPATVRVSASRPARDGALHLHFVNYNRVEPEKPKSAGGGIKDEKPIAVKGIKCSGLLPEGMRLRAVRFFTPEVDGVVELKWKLNGRKITFTVPEFLVYGVVELDY